MSRPRVLALFVDRPWPATTGNMQRVQALVDAVHADAELRVVVAGRGVGAMASPPPGLDVVEHPRSESSIAAIAGFAAGLPHRRPPMMAFYRQRALRQAFAEEHRRFAPDLVLTHHLGGAAIVDGLIDPGQVVLDLPDFDVQRFDRMRTLGGPVGRVRYGLDARLTAAWLRSSLADFRAVTVVSEEDAAAYRRLVPSTNVVLVPNGANPPPAPRADPGSREVLFLGDLAYPPNRDGIEWFIREVLPNAEAVEAVRVVGRGEVNVAERVVACGFVDDLSVELRRATAMVVPLRVGGGTRLKVLEAFGWGIPVVSTALGVEGLGALPDVHYVRAESPSEWPAALTRVLGDATLRRRLATAARALVDERFTWPATTAPLVRLLGAG